MNTYRNFELFCKSWWHSSSFSTFLDPRISVHTVFCLSMIVNMAYKYNGKEELRNIAKYIGNIGKKILQVESQWLMRTTQTIKRKHDDILNPYLHRNNLRAQVLVLRSKPVMYL